MSLFKILRGPSSRISMDTTPFHDGYAYLTPDDGGFYIDAEYNGEQKRIRINDDEEVKNLIDDKVSIAQGTEDAGKYMGVDASGNVAPIAFTWGALLGSSDN